MSRPAERPTRRPGRQAGEATIEWTLLLVVFGLPMVYVIGLLLSALVEHWRFVTFLETLPFP
jgi:ABC-type sugar transport system permease subunit